jgi:hypothetical protein
MMVATMGVDADDSRRGGLALVDIGAEAQRPWHPPERRGFLMPLFNLSRVVISPW